VVGWAPGASRADGQGDVVGRAGTGDRDVVAGLDGGARKRGAELARADDAEAEILDLWVDRARALGYFDRCHGHVQLLTAAASSA
jgi:hypothetical protein